MELRRVADSVLRSQTTPLSFLTPSLSSKCQSIAQKAVTLPQRSQVVRPFSSTRRTARVPTVTTSASKPEEAPAKATGSASWLSAGKGPGRKSPFSSPGASNASDPNTSRSPLFTNQASSVNDLLSSLSRGAARTPGAPNTFDIRRMADAAPRFEMADLMKDVSKGIAVTAPVRPPMRLTPTMGRTVNVMPGIDVGRSFRMLEQSCGRNKVRSDFNKQRFHERPGLKRKRLKSMRWRKNFMLGFKATISRVKQLKKQGW